MWPASMTAEVPSKLAHRDAFCSFPVAAAGINTVSVSLSNAADLCHSGPGPETHTQNNSVILFPLFVGSVRLSTMLTGSATHSTGEIIAGLLRHLGLRGYPIPVPISTVQTADSGRMKKLYPYFFFYAPLLRLVHLPPTDELKTLNPAAHHSCAPIPKTTRIDFVRFSWLSHGVENCLFEIFTVVGIVTYIRDNLSHSL